MHDDELTPEERAAMEALPRERPPDRALEERIVRALRAQGLLERRAVLRLTQPATGSSGTSRTIWLAAAWSALTAASRAGASSWGRAFSANAASVERAET